MRRLGSENRNKVIGSGRALPRDKASTAKAMKRARGKGNPSPRSNMLTPWVRLSVPPRTGHTMKDGWTRVAMSDDTLVAELLLRLKQPISHQSSPLHRGAAASVSFPPLEWGMRQPRSKKEGDPTARRSPTTPLSWSGGSGGRAGAGASPSDGYEEESSLPTDPHSDVRSKGIGAIEKRPRKKKTFAELKEEESSHLKERSYLKKELAALRTALKEQRSVNQRLKRMKIGLSAESGATFHEPVAKSSATSSSCPTPASVSSVLEGTPCASKRYMPKDHLLPEWRLEEENAGGQEQAAALVLPDLNMMPDEDFGPERVSYPTPQAGGAS